MKLKKLLRQDETLTKGLDARRNETLWHKTNEDADYLTHEGEGNRWKQSGIRDDRGRASDLKQQGS